MAALLLLIGGALTPTGLDKPMRDLDGALKELPIAAAHSGQLYLANLLVLVGLGALGLSFWVIAPLARDRGAMLAEIAASIGVVAAFCGVVVNVLIGFDLAAAATAHTPREDAARVLVSGTTSMVGNLVLVVYLGGLVVAFVVMGVALWRGGRVPRWLAVLFVVASLAAAAGPPGLVGAVMAAPFVVVMFLLASKIRSDTHEVSPPPSRSRLDRVESAAAGSAL